MKREEKSALSKQRIIEAAIQEFSRNGYNGASLNTVCAENGISKGIIYHYFKDKNELYLVCVRLCFEKLTQYMKERRNNFTGTLEEKLQAYFDGRFRFFLENPLFLGIFADAAFTPPASLIAQIAVCRRDFDEFSISVLTEFLSSEHVRKDLTIPAIVEDFRSYIDYFNLRFAGSFGKNVPSESVLCEHEKMCYRQLNMLLYGVLNNEDEK
jgi:TetR/AcrR family transcriptional regulator